MQNLIERLEKATGPDRELDRAIANFLRPDLKSASPPFFTGSLDTSRTLILPEHSFGGLSQISPNDWLMMIFSRTDSRARWEGEASTAELAVCIAALKASA